MRPVVSIAGGLVTDPKVEVFLTVQVLFAPMPALANSIFQTLDRLTFTVRMDDLKGT